MAELLPCPFCGGIPQMIKTRSCGRYVLCLDCDARTEESVTDDIGSAYDKAIAAWNRRAQQENKPLTLEELYQAESEPLYFFCTVGRWLLNGWHIVEPLSYANYGFKDLRLDNKDGHVIDTFNYGKTWVAYRSKPKEEV